MTYSEILRKLEEMGERGTNTAMVATSCDSAYESYEEELREYNINYDEFCSICEDIWMDCEDNTGITVIADCVAEYICDHDGETPERYVDII
jgi:hypothetical protein